MSSSKSSESASAGFTLIELLIVVGVMPLVIGAIAVGILSIFSLQGSVSNRLTDSGDAQLVSLNWQNDVQSAVSITTQSNPTSPSPCLPAGSAQVPVLNLQLGDGSVVTYGAAPSSTEKNADDLYRNVCPAGSTVPSSSRLLAHDVPLTVSTPGSAVTITCAQSSVACVGAIPAYQSGWVSTLGVTGVTFNVTAPESKFQYKVTAVPVAVANSSNLGTPSVATTGCGFATLNTGNSNLCFVDFTKWNAQNGAQCPNNMGLAMTANVANTPFNLSFCVKVTAHLNSGPAITGNTSQGGRVGFNDITAVPFPTYYNPPTSESFMGNNGFYSGVPNSPALYEVDEGSTATVSISSISLTGSNGQGATNWQLVTGDAESTDPGESISWNSDQSLNIINNSANSPVGNACESQPPTFNAQELTGVGTTTVTCTGTQNADHTGTVMLQAQTPRTLNVTMVGTGLQGMFMGVLLQS